MRFRHLEEQEGRGKVIPENMDSRHQNGGERHAADEEKEHPAEFAPGLSLGKESDENEQVGDDRDRAATGDLPVSAEGIEHQGKLIEDQGHANPVNRSDDAEMPLARSDKDKISRQRDDERDAVDE